MKFLKVQLEKFTVERHVIRIDILLTTTATTFPRLSFKGELLHRSVTAISCIYRKRVSASFSFHAARSEDENNSGRIFRVPGQSRRLAQFATMRMAASFLKKVLYGAKCSNKSKSRTMYSLCAPR